MNLRLRFQTPVRFVSTAQMTESTGGIYRAQTITEQVIQAHLVPPHRRMVFFLSGNRLTSERTVIAKGQVTVGERDYVYLPGDLRAYKITGLRRLPGHTEIDVELMQ